MLQFLIVSDVHMYVVRVCIISFTPSIIHISPTSELIPFPS